MALTKLTETIELEMTGDTRYYLVSAKQGDKATRTIIAKLYNNGKEYQIPNNSRVNINIKKPDGNHVYNTCTYTGSEVTIDLTNQALAAAGTAYCDIEIRTNDDAQILSSVSFTIEIEPSMRNENAILSSNEFTELENRIKNANDIVVGAKEAEEKRVVSETERVEAENYRKQQEETREQNENTRILQEEDRQKNTTEIIKSAESAVTTATGAAQKCVEASASVTDAVAAANGATEKALNAAKEAEAAAKACEGIVNGLNTMVDTVTGVSCVMGIENGIITLREA